MSETLNIFDLIFIFSSIIFILIAFFRGFVKEIFALLNWIISTAALYWLAPYAAQFIAHYSNNKIVINIVSGILVFMGIFIISALLTNKLANAVKEKMPTPLDQIMGVLYGVIKTLLVFGLVYAFTVNIYSSLIGATQESEAKEIVEKKVEKEKSKEGKAKEEKAKEEKEVAKIKHVKKKKGQHLQTMPEWLAEAKTLFIYEGVGKMLNPYVKKTINDILQNFDESEHLKIKKEDEAPAAPEENAASEAEAQKSDEEYEPMGYSKKEIEKMNRLIEVIK